MSAFGIGLQFEALQRRKATLSPIRKWSFAIVRRCGNPHTKIISRNAARKADVRAKRSEFSDTDVRLADKPANCLR